MRRQRGCALSVGAPSMWVRPECGCALSVGAPSGWLQPQGSTFQDTFSTVTIVFLNVSLGTSVRCIQVYRYDHITKLTYVITISCPD